MKSYTKTYFKHFGYTIDEKILCEVCNNVAVDIHHINCKGMGGSKTKDNIENIMALCRSCHIEFGDKKQYIELLTNIHNTWLNKQ